VRDLFEEMRIIKSGSKQLIDAHLLNPAGTSYDQLFNVDVPVIHFAMSRIALRLDEAKEEDAAMRAAFKAAGLNHRDPSDWRALLWIFAEAHYGKQKTKRQTWDLSALSSLLEDYRAVEKDLPPTPSRSLNSRICEHLRTKKPYKQKYGRLSHDALRKVVGKARNPKTNLLLIHPEMKDSLLQIFRVELERKGMTWTPEFEAAVKKLN
jgi:hypothetical protein